MTNEEFLKKLSIKNPNIISLEEYKGNKINILCCCKDCGHKWMVCPGNLLSGKGCPKCAIRRNVSRRTKTQFDFIKELEEKNPRVEALELYKNIKTKILFCCKKCGHKWQAKPSHVLNGHGCPVCGGSLKKSHKTFISQLKTINARIEVLETYVNAKTKILCRCVQCDHKWEALPTKLLQGNGCPNCSKRDKTSFPEQAIYYYLKKVYPDAINRYCIPNGKVEIDIFIPSLNLGIEYDGVYWHKSKIDSEKQKYLKCKESNISLFRVRESIEPVLDIADIVFVRQKPYNFNSLDLVINQIFNELKLGANVCTSRDAIKIYEQFYKNLDENSLATQYPKVALEWNKDKNCKITPKMVSYGSNKKFWWKCVICQHEWISTVADRTVGKKGCPKCAKNKISNMYKMKNTDFIEKLKEKNTNLMPLEEYKGYHENILIRCKICNNEWFASPANILHGRNCPVCSRKNRKKILIKNL